MHRPLLSLLLAVSLLTVTGAGCDESPISDLGTFRAGEVFIATGEPLGPCFADADNTYHWCDPAPAGYPLMCAVPQVNGKPHASVCIERRGEGECPEWKAYKMNDGTHKLYPIVQDYWNGCALSCDVDTDCPQYPDAMICSAGTCAWETF